jgi:hypothetical protein
MLVMENPERNLAFGRLNLLSLQEGLETADQGMKE